MNSSIFLFPLNICFNLQYVLTTEKITYQPIVNHYIIAISTVLKDYRLAHFINQEIHVKLEKTDDYIVDSKKEEKAESYSRYYFYDDKSDFEYFLMQNKHFTNTYLKRLKNFDFIFVIKTIDVETIDIATFFEKIKRLPEVQIALEINELKKAEMKAIIRDF